MRRFALVVVAACGSQGGAPSPPPPPTVDVTTLQPGEVVDATEYLATLRSRTAAVLQPQVEGQITQIFVKPGERVRAGQPLLQINPGPQPAALQQAAAAREAQEAALGLAEVNLRRTAKLVAEGAVPAQELDNIRATVENQRAQVEALGAQVKSSRVQLRYYRVVAPSAGVVGDIPWRIGDKVTQQTRLTTVTDNAVLEARVAVPVDRATKVTSTTRIDIVDSTAQGTRVVGTGTAKFVSPQVSFDTQTVLVTSDIDNSRNTMRTDQVSRARVVWDVHRGLRVPALAVTRLGGQQFVFVAAQQGGGLVARQRPVKLGDLVDNQYVVLEGLQPGERIVVSGIQKLRDGAAIKVKG